MEAFLALTLVGLVTGAIYAISATGLVVTYVTSGVFNFAHGAIGMLGAFLFWQFSVQWRWPVPLALALVLIIIAPLLGASAERVLIRPLRAPTLEVTLTITVGLLLFVVGLATMIWDPTVARNVPAFFPDRSVTVAGTVLSWHQLLIIAVTVAVAVLLRAFFVTTRAGIAMRAVVDDPDLLALAGAPPSRYTALAWALGGALAALAGILIAPLITLDVQALTLLVINGYAAAMVGRLRSLPLTFLGGIILGLLESYAVGYLPVNVLTQTKAALPMLFLVVVLLTLPQLRLAGDMRSVLQSANIANPLRSIIGALCFVVLAVIGATFLPQSLLATLGHGVALALIMLSLVILTGYSAQVSLGQLAFAGFGAFVMAKVGAYSPTLGLLAATTCTGALGIVVALPALRLRGLYLALLTLAFAYAMDAAFFSNTQIFGYNVSLSVARIELPGVPFPTDRTFFVEMCIVFAAVAVGVLALRRSAFGRNLVALGDSPTACVTLGMNLTATKLIVFGIAAAVAGLGGALYGAEQGVIGPSDFSLLANLALVLIAVVFGVRTVSGMLFGGFVLAFMPVLQSMLPLSVRDVTSLLVGGAAIGIGRNPSGIFGAVARRPRVNMELDAARALAFAKKASR